MIPSYEILLSEAGALDYWKEGVLGLCTLSAAILAWVKSLKDGSKLKAAELAMKFQSGALSFSDFLEEWNECHAELCSMLDETKMDRFLILRCWNGDLSPRWTTAVFQFRSGDQKPISYVHTELDSHYVDNVRKIVEKGSVVMEVSDLPPSVVKDIYEAEGVKHSAWFHVCSSTLEGTKSRSITYCSFATHKPEAFESKELTRFRLFVSRLKGLADLPKDRHLPV